MVVVGTTCKSNEGRFIKKDILQRLSSILLDCVGNRVLGIPVAVMFLVRMLRSF